MPSVDRIGDVEVLTRRSQSGARPAGGRRMLSPTTPALDRYHGVDSSVANISISPELLLSTGVQSTTFRLRLGYHTAKALLASLHRRKLKLVLYTPVPQGS